MNQPPVIPEIKQPIDTAAPASAAATPRGARLLLVRPGEGNHARQAAHELAAEFATSAAERDRLGGTPKPERDALRNSGLLSLSIPKEFGGMGASWRETLDVVRILARADSSLAHVFGFHHLMLATARLFGQPRQWQPWFEQTARHKWF